MKKCQCGETDLTMFGKDKNRHDGLKPLCRKCHNKKNTERRQSSPEKHRRVNLAYSRSPQGRAKQRANNLRRKYWPHLTNDEAVSEYNNLLASQNYACALCDRPQATMKHALHVDHCKHSGIIRGLLCDVCNRIEVQDKTFIRVKKLYNYFAKYHKE